MAQSTTSQSGGGSTTCPPAIAAAMARPAKALSWAHPTRARDGAKATNLIWKGKGRPRLVASEGDGPPRMIVPFGISYSLSGRLAVEAMKVVHPGLGREVGLQRQPTLTRRPG
jgi:hypothetical protein